jgi:hypothetical protein
MVQGHWSDGAAVSSFLRNLARASHKVSTISGDAAAYQSGGFPRLFKRIVRRKLTAKTFQVGRRAL